MKINRNMKIHIAIFELFTEEESVITIYNLLKVSDYKVSLFLSRKIWEIIRDNIAKNDLEILEVYDNNLTFIHLKQEIERHINNNKIDLFILTRFQSTSIKETKCYIDFFKNNKTLVGIFNYGRWFSYLPSIEFNGLKIIKRHLIRDWLYCHLVIKYIYSFFISEIHQHSSNPLKKYLKKYVEDDHILDIPFKITEKSYNPNFNYEYPIFVIPGRIEKKRRRYLSIMKFFQNKELKKYKWKLILLGRPIGKYGVKVIKIAKQINSCHYKNRIIYFDKYISKNKYDELVNQSTHILAPINENFYKKGKDSGAIYDVFKYNKIGIFNDSYFYSRNLVEKKVLICYKNKIEFYNILQNIISNKISYQNIVDNIGLINKHFNRNNYLSCIKNSFISNFNVE